MDVFLKENPHLERWQVADPEREVKQDLVLPSQLSASFVLYVWSCCLAWDILAGIHAWNGNNAVEGSGKVKITLLSKKKNLMTQSLTMLSQRIYRIKIASKVL